MCEQFMPVSARDDRLQLQRCTLENVAQAIRALKQSDISNAQSTGRDAYRPDPAELADHLYSHSHFHDGEPNSTAELMREGAACIRKLLASMSSVARMEGDDLPVGCKPSGKTRQWHDRLGSMIDQIGQPDYSLRELVVGLREIHDEMRAADSSGAK